MIFFDEVLSISDEIKPKSRHFFVKITHFEIIEIIRGFKKSEN